MSSSGLRRALPMVCLALLSACGAKVSAETPDEPQTEVATTTDDPNAIQVRDLPKVRTTLVRRQDMQRYLETTAAVQSVSEIDVVAEATGRVLAIQVQEGDIVTKGQVLANLDARDQETALADARVAVTEAEAVLERGQIAEREADAGTRSAKLALAQAQRDYERNEKLGTGEATNLLSKQTIEASRLARDNADEAVKQAELAQARSKVDSRSFDSALDRANLAVERAKRDVERTKLTAPIDAVIAMRSVEQGRNLASGEVAFQLTDPNNLRVIFFRPQRELNLFSKGARLPITATTEARTGFKFTGAIARTSPTIDRESGAFRVTAHMDPTSQPNEAGETTQLLPGMLLKLMVETGRHKDSLAVPKRAIRREGASVFVLAIEDGKLRRVAVKEGFSSDEDVEITPIGSELTNGAELVLIGSRDLEDGDAVQIDKTDA